MWKPVLAFVGVAAVIVAAAIVITRVTGADHSTSRPSPSIAPTSTALKQPIVTLTPPNTLPAPTAVPSTAPPPTIATVDGTPLPSRAGGTLTVLVPRPKGSGAKGPTWAQISGDGRTAFVRTADPLLANLPPSDTNVRLFAVDVASGAVRLVTDDGSLLPKAVSFDGSFIVAIQNRGGSSSSVVRIDTKSGATSPVLPDSIVGTAQQVDISADGSTIAISLVPPAGSASVNAQLYVVDTATGAVDTSLLTADGPLYKPHLSADGSVLAFTSDAKNLPVGPGAVGADAVVLDRTTGTMSFAYSTNDGQPPNSPSIVEGLSWDGSVVTISSLATNLESSRTGSGSTLSTYQFNRTTHHTGVVVMPGTPVTARLAVVGTSADGRRLLLGGDMSPSLYLFDEDVNRASDVLPTTNGHQPDTPVGQSAQRVSIDAAGTRAVVIANARNLGGGADGYNDVYIWTANDVGRTPDPRTTATTTPPATTTPATTTPAVATNSAPVATQPTQRWQVKPPGTLKWMEFEPGTVYVSVPLDGSFTILAIDTATGKLQWATPPPPQPVTSGFFARVDDELVEVYSDNTTTTTFAFIDRATGAVISTTSADIGKVQMPVVNQGFVVGRDAAGLEQLLTVDVHNRRISEPTSIDYYYLTNDDTFIVQRNGELTVPDPITMEPVGGFHFPRNGTFDDITHTYDGHFVVAVGGIISGLDASGAIRWSFDPGLGRGVRLQPLNDGGLILATAGNTARVIAYTDHEAHAVTGVLDGLARADSRTSGAAPTFLLDGPSGHQIVTIRNGTMVVIGSYAAAINDPWIVINGNVLTVWTKFGASARPNEPSPLTAFDATTGTQLWTLDLQPDQRVALPPDGVLVWSDGSVLSSMTLYSDR